MSLIHPEFDTVMDVMMSRADAQDPFTLANLASTSASMRARVDAEWPRLARELTASTLALKTDRGREVTRIPGKHACSMCGIKKISCMRVLGIPYARCRSCAHDLAPPQERLVSLAKAREKFMLSPPELAPFILVGSCPKACFLHHVLVLAFAKFGGPKGLRNAALTRDARRRTLSERRERTWEEAMQAWEDDVVIVDACKYKKTRLCYRKWFVASGRRQILHQTLRWMGRVCRLRRAAREIGVPDDLLQRCYMVKSYVFGDREEDDMYDILEHLSCTHWLHTHTTYESHLEILLGQGIPLVRARAMARSTALREKYDTAQGNEDTLAYISYFSMVPAYY